MRNTTFVLFFVILSSHIMKSQNNNQISLNISYNQFEIGYHQKFLNEHLWGQVFLGLANQDVNAEFDDFLTGIRAGIPILYNQKNSVDINLGFGLYFPNNDYYKVTTPFVEIGPKYSRHIGKSNKHNVSLSAGCRYGKRSYKQDFDGDNIYIETVDDFKVDAFYISIGYGFLF